MLFTTPAQQVEPGRALNDNSRCCLGVFLQASDNPI
jgi:hypothetical protein